MHSSRRAAQAAPLLAVVLASGLAASGLAAQAPQPGRIPVRATRTEAAPAPAPARLPAMRARPPASRRNQPAPVPAALRRPAPAPAAARPDPAATPRLGVAPANGEKWEAITPEAVNAGPARLPVGRGSAGPTVLRVQVMLDRALFSPGMIDGKWGKNTENAVFWLQQREGLPATGVVDQATYTRLALLAGSPDQIVRAHMLTADDVRGPFAPIPGNIYEHAKLRCSCYETLSEKLTETFHATRDLLRRLNPGVNLDKLAAGATLHVPAVRNPEAAPLGEVRQILVSGSGSYLQALDAAGRILYHFAATLGSTYDPSPQGDFSVRGVHPNPWWHYQPGILAHVPDDRPNAMIPPGPNNSVGKVWIALSVAHYGIHGTKSPETIGYATSAGCVRLTNWDVTFLSQRLQPGVPVRFVDTRKPSAPRDTTRTAAPAGPALAGVRADSARMLSQPPPDLRPAGVVPADTAKRDSAAPAPAPVRPDTPNPAPPAPAPTPPPPPDTGGAKPPTP